MNAKNRERKDNTGSQSAFRSLHAHFQCHWPAYALSIIAIAIRLWRLGMPALRADTIIFWNFFVRGFPPSHLFAHWMELMGVSGQFPLPVAMIRVFLNITNLPVTEFNIRLFDVFWAGLCVFAAFQIGRILISRLAGFVWGVLLAVHPYFIQATREPYFYPPMLCGLMLMAWGAAVVVQGCSSKEPKKVSWLQFTPLTVCGFALAIYSQPSGWGLSALLAAVVFLALLLKKYWREAIILGVAMLLTGLPMLFAPWGLPQVLELTSGAHQQENIRLIAGETRLPFLEYLRNTFMTFGWGHGTVRGLLVLAALCLWAEDIRRHFRNPARMFFALILFGGAAFSILGQTRTLVYQESRYMLGVFPFFLACNAQGIAGLCERINLSRIHVHTKRILQCSVVAIFFLPLLQPAVWALSIKGSPTPYKEIIQWLDTQLPSGTPVLVDRWFEPWNEFRVYPSTNVFLTFTVPNEPLDVYLKVNWRETAKTFFTKFPDAAYMELAKSYWEKPQVGPWSWPHQYFKNKGIIRDEAALKLRNLGLLYRNDSGLYTNRIVTEIYYNTRDNYIEACRNKGLSFAIWYGPGWGYVKTQDYRDWRTLSFSAELEAHNLTENSRENVFINIRAVSLKGAKKIRVHHNIAEFAQDRFEEHQIGPLTLLPGQTRLVLRDDQWSGMGSTLLVDSIMIADRESQPSQ